MNTSRRFCFGQGPMETDICRFHGLLCDFDAHHFCKK